MIMAKKKRKFVKKVEYNFKIKETTPFIMLLLSISYFFFISETILYFDFNKFSHFFAILSVIGIIAYFITILLLRYFSKKVWYEEI